MSEMILNKSALGYFFKSLEADYEVLVLEGAKHGFSNPQADVNAEKYGIDLGYQQQADAQSWAAMQTLLGRVF